MEEPKKEEPVRDCLKNLKLYQHPECDGESEYPPADAKLNEYYPNLKMIITGCEDGKISMNFGDDKYSAKAAMPIVFHVAQKGFVKCVQDSSYLIAASFTQVEKEPM